MKHQNDVVRFCLNSGYKHNGIFADYGTGKSLIALMIIEIMRKAEEHQFKSVLVVATTLAIETTWCDEIKKHSDFRFCILRGTAKAKVNLLTYAMGKVNDPNRYGYHNELNRPMLFLLNYEGVKSIHNELSGAGFDAVFADECFMAGTMIDIPNGKRCIETVKIGDTVSNVTGEDTVIGVSQKELLVVVKVSYNGKEVYCSENHLFFTNRGWVKVYGLVEGDVLYATVYGQQVMRMVRERVFWKNYSKQEKGSGIVGFRVDGVESYKSGSIEFNRFSSGRDTITFYDLQVKNHPSYSVEGIIVHNSTKIKTHDAKRTMAMYEVGGHIPYRYIMTGFPITENLGELYSQVKFLDRGKTFGLSYYAFINKYFVRLGQKIVVKKRAIKQIIDLISPFCIRVTNETLKLPPKTYKPVRLDMTDQQRELLLQLNETFRLELGKVKIDTKYIFTLISKSLQICDGFVQHTEYEKDDKGKNTNKVISSELEIIDTNKDEALVETLNEIDVTKNKVVIWCAFLFSVSKVELILKKLGIRTLSLTGATEDSNKVVQMFQRSREYNVLICTQKKAAESVTLTSARYAIYYSNIWSNDARLNSEARIRRKGSEIHKNIMYIDLITKDSVEEKVYQCLRKKKDLINELKAAFLEMKRG